MARPHEALEPSQATEGVDGGSGDPERGVSADRVPSKHGRPDLSLGAATLHACHDHAPSGEEGAPTYSCEEVGERVSLRVRNTRP